MKKIFGLLLLLLPLLVRAQDLCEEAKCGPRLGMPNRLCSDNTTVAGPTGRCLLGSDGTCGWEIKNCPTEVPPTEGCGPVCAIFCEFGNEVDEKGCPICRCKNESSPTSTCGPVCAIFCPFGNEVDEKGCPICRCKNGTTPTPMEGCGPVCAIFCPFGNEVDEKGCPICRCKNATEPSTKPPEECGPVCAIFCTFGNVLDENGCPTCRCKNESSPSPPPEECGPVCAIFCPFGNVLDEKGCPTCRCRNETSPCHVKNCPAKPDPVPCPNGSDSLEAVNCTAGPTGECRWEFTRCAPSCPALECLRWIKCAKGMVIDANGCPTCECVQCPPISDCKKLCPLGFVMDKNNCSTCECVEPVCKPSGIACKYCPNGYLRDQNGCRTCECACPPGVPTVQCLVDPCSNPAPAGCKYDRCNADYCGSCRARYFDANSNEVCLEEPPQCPNGTVTSCFVNPCTVTDPPANCKFAKCVPDYCDGCKAKFVDEMGQEVCKPGNYSNECQISECGPRILSAITCPQGSGDPIEKCLRFPSGQCGWKVSCNNVTCPIYDCLPNTTCPNGFARDRNGCVSCQCAECPAVLCDLYCETGYEADEKGCPTCKCKNVVCPDINCSMRPEGPCPFGLAKDERGCLTCDCAPCADKLACNMTCPSGYLLDEAGCPACACKPIQCPVMNMMCRYCPNGYERDANGCPTCNCKKETEETCAALTTEIECASKSPQCTPFTVRPISGNTTGKPIFVGCGPCKKIFIQMQRRCARKLNVKEEVLFEIVEGCPLPSSSDWVEIDCPGATPGPQRPDDAGRDQSGCVVSSVSKLFDQDRSSITFAAKIMTPASETRTLSQLQLRLVTVAPVTIVKSWGTKGEWRNGSTIGTQMVADIDLMTGGLLPNQTRGFGFMILTANPLAILDYQFSCNYTSSVPQIPSSVKVTLTFQINPNEWDEKVFVNRLAKILDLKPSQIKVTKVTGLPKKRNQLQSTTPVTIQVEIEIQTTDAVEKASSLVQMVNTLDKSLGQEGVRIDGAAYVPLDSAITTPPPTTTTTPVTQKSGATKAFVSFVFFALGLVLFF